LRIRVVALSLIALVLSGLAPASAGAAAATGHLSGLIENEHGSLLSGATVRLANTAGSLLTTVTADEHGHYSATVPTGTYDVAVSASTNGTPVSARVLDVKVAGPDSLNVVIVGGPVPRVTLTGAVRDGAGNPVPHASVFVGAQTVTDTDGRFLLEVAPGHYPLAVELPVPQGLIKAEVADFDLSADRAVDLTLPVIAFDVSVRNEAGAPLPATAVRLSSDESCSSCPGAFELVPGAATRRHFTMGARTDADGHVRLLGLPSSDLDLSVVKPSNSYRSVEKTGLTVEASTSFDIVLPTRWHATGLSSPDQPAVTLQGRVLSAAGGLAWIEHGHLVAESDGSTHPFTLGDGGGYTVSVPPGGYRITLDTREDDPTPSHDYYEWSLSSTVFELDSDRTLDLTVPAEGADIRVVDTQGRPVAGYHTHTKGSSAGDFELAPEIRASAWFYTHFVGSGDGEFPVAVLAPSLLSGQFSPQTEDSDIAFSGLHIAPREHTVMAYAEGSDPRSLGAPRDVQARAEGPHSASVTWSPAWGDGGSPVFGYLVRVNDGDGGQLFVKAPVTSATVTGLTPGTTYRISVAAINARGVGDRSVADAIVTEAGATLPAVPEPPTTPAGDPAVPGRARAASGYWMVGADGRVYPFGEARHLGEPSEELGSATAVDLEPTPAGEGYWVLDDQGRVFAYGDALRLGDAKLLGAGERATSLSATPSGRGYWVFTTTGRVLSFGDAAFFGDMSSVRLNGAVLDSVATPSGRGYYMVAADGGVFTFGDARFSGSMGNHRLNAPVQSLVPDGDGDGYWLVSSDGGIFAFDAPFRGSMGDTRLNRPVTGMVRFGDGYLMVGEDGGIFNFSDKAFHGSLGDNPPERPVVAVAALP
jgi:fibronectin type III domain protein/carboxypeptidase family protein